MTKLFGRAPAGMNATGESDLQNYYDSIETKQEDDLRPVLEKLLPVLCLSELGAVPDDLEFQFNPVRRPSDEEKRDLASKGTTSIVEAFNAGVIDHQTALKELRQMSEFTGQWSNITDEMIERASSEFEPAGEELPGGMGAMGFASRRGWLRTRNGRRRIIPAERMGSLAGAGAPEAAAWAARAFPGWGNRPEAATARRKVDSQKRAEERGETKRLSGDLTRGTGISGNRA